MRIFPFLIALTCCSYLATAQTTATTFPPLKIGEWQQHLPWQRSTCVTQSDANIYFSTEWAVVEIDKVERTPNFITKVEGLSDVGINLIRFNKSTNALVIAYTNSNLDLYYPADGSVQNLPFIQKNPNLIGDKKIYDLFFDGKTAYFSCGFGLLKFDVETAEAAYTVFTDMPVYAAAVYSGYIWMGTEDGLYRLEANDENPADFSRWKLIGAAEGFPVGVTVNALNVWDNRLVLGVGTSLMQYDGGSFGTLAFQQNRTVKYLTADGPGLVIGWSNESPNAYGIGNVEYLETSGSRYEIHWPCAAEFPLYGIESAAKTFWLADQNDGFRFYDHNKGQCDNFTFNSPLRHVTTEIAIANNKVFLATPGTKSTLEPLGEFRTGVYINEDRQWTRFWGESNPEIKPSRCNQDMWRVAAHPVENKFYVGSRVGGLIEATEPGVAATVYTKDNSILQNGAAGQDDTAIGGMAFDAVGNLWVSNYSATAPIAVLKADKTWKNFNAAPATNLLQVAVDQAGYKWFVLAFNAGIMVFDSGTDIDDTADDRYKIFTTANSVLPTNTVNCISVDLDGDVWVGTQQGVVSFECGSNVFSEENPCLGRRRIVNVDGFNGYLLETEDVRTIAVDGANRKWFGTSNGVFVQSSDGLTQEALFTNTNSPLFDNAITDIAVNQQTGEVWIGTEKGVISLRGEATEGPRVNTTNAYAYPNPVLADYDGPIAVYGLARDANVKITDIAGNLVYEGKSLGGQAVWDGRDYLGRKVASGVYLIYATSQATFDEPDAIITKVVILN